MLAARLIALFSSPWILRGVNPKSPVLRLRLARWYSAAKPCCSARFCFVLFQGRDSFCSFLYSQESARLCLPSPGVRYLAPHFYYWLYNCQSHGGCLTGAYSTGWQKPVGNSILIPKQKSIEFLFYMKLSRYSKPNSKFLFPVPGNWT